MNKILLSAAGTLLIGGGAYLSYLKAQPREQLSDLTLANIEALGFSYIEIGDDIYTDDAYDRGDCMGDPNSNCGQPVVTQNGHYMEYLIGATKRPGWA